MTARSFSVDLCNGFTKIGEASSFGLSAIVRNLAAGQWQLSAPLAGLDMHADLIHDVDSILVVNEDAGIEYAGIVRPVGSIQSGTSIQVTPTGTQIAFTGVDMFALLGVRSCWPTPSTPAPWVDAHDVQSGQGSTVAAHYIEANIGASALPNRSIAGITVVDPGVGDSSTWSARLQPLDEFVAQVCRESGITCRASMPAAGQIVYTFLSPNDLSASVLLTDKGDLKELSQLVTPSAGTHVIAAGQGDLTARSFAVADSGATGLDRVESVYESTNVSTSAGLISTATSRLAALATSAAVDGELADGASQRIRYLVDYDIGDRLGVEIDDVRYSSQVEAVRFELTAMNQSVSPVLGRASINRAVQLTRDINELSSQFSRSIA